MELDQLRNEDRAIVDRELRRTHFASYAAIVAGAVLIAECLSGGTDSPSQIARATGSVLIFLGLWIRFTGSARYDRTAAAALFVTGLVALVIAIGSGQWISTVLLAVASVFFLQGLLAALKINEVCRTVEAIRERSRPEAAEDE